MPVVDLRQARISAGLKRSGGWLLSQIFIRMHRSDSLELLARACSVVDKLVWGLGLSDLRPAVLALVEMPGQSARGWRVLLVVSPSFFHTVAGEILQLLAVAPDLVHLVMNGRVFALYSLPMLAQSGNRKLLRVSCSLREVDVLQIIVLGWRLGETVLGGERFDLHPLAVGAELEVLGRLGSIVGVMIVCSVIALNALATALASLVQQVAMDRLELTSRVVERGCSSSAQGYNSLRLPVILH